METEPAGIRLTIDEIGPDQHRALIATLITDARQQVIVPLDLLPDGARVGDVLLAHFVAEPDERERRRQHISDLQRRLFGSG